jgi:hypothetical protein
MKASLGFDFGFDCLACNRSSMPSSSNGLRYLRVGGDGEAVQPEK